MSKSNLEKRAEAALRYYVKNVLKEKVESVRHVHPRCHVLGYAAPRCLIVHAPWQDSEAHLQDWDRQYPLKPVHTFEEGIEPGDCVAVGYVVVRGCQENIAVKMED